MEEHPIEKLMDTAMTNIKEMVDVNTIVGDAVETIDGSVIIPISRVCFGFAAGGGDIDNKSNNNQNNKQTFSGGSGGGIMLNPMAFLVVNKEQVRLLPVTGNGGLDRLLNIAPELLKEIKNIINKKETNYTNG